VSEEIFFGRDAELTEDGEQSTGEGENDHLEDVLLSESESEEESLEMLCTSAVVFVVMEVALVGEVIPAGCAGLEKLTVVRITG